MTVSNGLAPKPPMGWNSYDCYGLAVTEAEIRATADVMAARLARHGWRYVVIDHRWFDRWDGPPNEGIPLDVRLDPYGRLLPAVNKFPSAAGDAGFKALADGLHAKGLKLGIHVMRGIPRRAVEKNVPIRGASVRARDIADVNSTCAWSHDMYGVDTNRPGAQAWYDSVLQLYAGWGVDYIKVDDIASPYHGGEIEAVSRARDKYGRPVILSLSPGDNQTTEPAEHLKRHCELWRTTGDVWDYWKHIQRAFEVLPQWMAHQGPGRWPDADMLPLGRIGIRSHGGDRATRLTPDEQRTLVTLFCICRSPLMFGGDLMSLDDFTLSLLTNDEVLAVDQDGRNPRELFRRDREIAWVSEDPASGDAYLAVFNAGEAEATVAVDLATAGINGQWNVRDLWARKAVCCATGHVAPEIAPHGCGLYQLSRG